MHTQMTMDTSLSAAHFAHDINMFINGGRCLFINTGNWNITALPLSDACIRTLNKEHDSPFLETPEKEVIHAATVYPTVVLKCTVPCTWEKKSHASFKGGVICEGLRASQSIFCSDYRAASWGAAPRLLTRKMGKLSSAFCHVYQCVYLCMCVCV